MTLGTKIVFIIALVLSIIIPFGYYLLGREKSRRRYKRAIGSNVFFFFGAFVVASIMLLGGRDVQAAGSVTADSGFATGLGYLAALSLPAFPVSEAVSPLQAQRARLWERSARIPVYSVSH